MNHGIVAAILSFIIPGLGQAYAGNLKKGILIFVIALAIATGLLILFNERIYLLTDLIISIYAAYDAYHMAN